MSAETLVSPPSKWAICPEFDIDCDARLFDSVEAARAWPRSNGSRGWLEEPLLVIPRAACAGPVLYRPRLRAWLRPEDIAPLAPGATTAWDLVQSGLQEIRGQTVWPSCYLDEDWDFESLEVRAWRLEGHDYTNRCAASVPEVVFKAVCDFDSLISNPDCALPTSAAVRFWQSWQMHRHVARFCKELETSRISGIPHATSFDWHDAEWKVRRLMNAYARATNQASATEPGGNERAGMLAGQAAGDSDGSEAGNAAIPLEGTAEGVKAETLAEFFDQFDPEEQALIRTKEAEAKIILRQGQSDAIGRFRAGLDREWVLQPQDFARAQAAATEFVGYQRVLVRRIDPVCAESVEQYLRQLDMVREGLLSKHGTSECEAALAEMRLEAERLAWLSLGKQLGSARVGKSPTAQPGATPNASAEVRPLVNETNGSEADPRAGGVAAIPSQGLTKGEGEMSLGSWQQIRDDFRQGAEAYPDVLAHWNSREELWTLQNAPAGEGGTIPAPCDSEAQDRFKKAARAAVLRLGKPIDEQPPCHTWLDLMRKTKRGFRPEAQINTRHFSVATKALEEGVSIPQFATHLLEDGNIAHVFLESAEFCEDLAHGVAGKALMRAAGDLPNAETGGHGVDTGRFPKRAEWLKDRLRERSWNKNDVSRRRGPDRKTVQKILDGRGVREDVLDKLATALSSAPESKKLPKLRVLDIPQN